MSRVRGRASFWPLATALLLTGGAAAAQTALPPPVAPPPPGSQPPPTYLGMTLRSDIPGLEFGVSATRRGEPLARCVDRCGLWLTPGRYYLKIPETDEFVGGSEAFRLQQPAHARVTTGTHGARTAGLVMGIIGTTLLGAGAVMILAGVGADNSSFADDSNRGTLVGIGLLAIIPGAILTPIGWSKFGRSKPHVVFDEE